MSAGQPVAWPPFPDPDRVVDGTPYVFADRTVVHPRPLWNANHLVQVQRDAYEAGKRDALAALTADPDVVERVARALADKDGRLWAVATEQQKDMCRKFAAIALAALTDTPKEQQA